MSQKDIARIVAMEKLAEKRLRAFLRRNSECLSTISRWGDGAGGYILGIVREELGLAEIRAEPSKKKKISASLAKAVLERDAYRCVTCGSHIDLTCDHVIPESKGGPTTLDNLQAMCRSCNCRKGARHALLQA